MVVGYPGQPLFERDCHLGDTGNMLNHLSQQTIDKLY